MILAGLVVVFEILAITSALILVRAATARPFVGALIERALIGLLIAVFGLVALGLVLNAETGRSVIDPATASVLFRLSLLALLGIPSLWVWLYRTGRLGSKQ